MTTLFCWRCGEALAAVAQPFERLAQCKACNADLHVCKMCTFYNPRVSEKCDHDSAEPARDPELANFCEYYKHDPEAFSGNRPKQDDPMAQLKALFGDDTNPADDALDEKPLSKEELAKQKLEELFNKGND